MATRNTRLILKNSDIVNRPYSGASVLAGEAIVNTADGIVLFSGVTTSTNEWTPSGPGGNANFFEVGSNLYDLALRNRITKYEGSEGAGLTGKFLSGTTNGFVLADISNIDGNFDNFTFSGDSGTIETIESGENLLFAGGTGIDSVSSTPNTITFNIDSTVATLTGTQTLTSKTIDATANTLNNLFRFSGTSSGSTVETVDGYETIIFSGTGGIAVTSVANNIVQFSAGTGNFTSFDVAADAGSNQTIGDGNTLTLVGGTGIDTSAQTGDNIVINIDKTVVTTGGTQTLENKTIDAGTFTSSITTDFLTAGRVVYVGAGGTLTDEAGFTYDDSSNTLSTPSDGAVNVGTGGLIVGSGGGPSTPGNGDVTIHGNLTIFGDSITASTGELYVEDSTITLNYNPTGDTTSTSIGSGWIIQDGSGNVGNDVDLIIAPMINLTGLTAGNIPDVSEYGDTLGYTDRGWITQLNDIVIRSTDTDNGDSSVNGVRVLAEFDVLDGGTY